MESAPAFTNGSSRISGFEHIRWTSKCRRNTLRTDLATSGPKEMFGTKCPSMMSRCNHSALERWTRAASWAKRPKSEASSDGAMIIGMKRWDRS